MGIDYQPQEGEQFTLPLGQHAILGCSRITYGGMSNQDTYLLNIGHTYGRLGDLDNDDSKPVFIPVPSKGGPSTLDTILSSDVHSSGKSKRIEPKVKVIGVTPMSIMLEYVSAE